MKFWQLLLPLVAGVLLIAATSHALEPKDAPQITNQIARLRKTITADTASSKLSRDDAAKFNVEVDTVEKSVATATDLSPAQRGALRKQLAKIASDITTAEGGNAGYFGKPAASP